MESIIHFPAGKPQYPQEPDSKRMCGDGRLETLAQAPRSPHLRAKFVKFKNGGYTKWHCHQGGEQVLYVTEGNGFVQADGQPKIRLHVGDRVYIPEGIWHRHGALEGEEGKFVHLAITTGETKYREHDSCG